MSKDTIKDILTGLGILAILTATFMFAQAHGAEAPTSVKEFAPISAILVEINHTPQEFVLTNATGTVAHIGVTACAKSPECVVIVHSLLATGKGDILNLQTGTDI